MLRGNALKIKFLIWMQLGGTVLHTCGNSIILESVLHSFPVVKRKTEQSWAVHTTFDQLNMWIERLSGSSDGASAGWSAQNQH